MAMLVSSAFTLERTEHARWAPLQKEAMSSAPNCRQTVSSEMPLLNVNRSGSSSDVPEVEGEVEDGAVVGKP